MSGKRVGGAGRDGEAVGGGISSEKGYNDYVGEIESVEGDNLNSQLDEK